VEIARELFAYADGCTFRSVAACRGVLGWALGHVCIGSCVGALLWLACGDWGGSDCLSVFVR